MSSLNLSPLLWLQSVSVCFPFSSLQQPDSENEHQSPSMSIDEPSSSCGISGTNVDNSKTKSTETLTVIDVDGNQYDKPSGI